MVNRKTGPDPEEERAEVIEADTVTIEVVDKTTGCLYRRQVPLCYHENSNGIILKGENLEGKSAVLALLSDQALAKYSDLIGMGPDAPTHHSTEKKKSKS
jgi:hypothetical protein